MAQNNMALMPACGGSKANGTASTITEKAHAQSRHNKTQASAATNANAVVLRQPQLSPTLLLEATTQKMRKGTALMKLHSTTAERVG